MYMKTEGGSLGIPIEVSARHIHISKEDFQQLFGTPALTIKRALSQPNQFAAHETLTIRTENGEISNVRIVGPFRPETQVELAVSDCRTLGITAHFSLSGTLEGSPGLTLVGPLGTLALKKGAIVPLTHLHLSPEEAASEGLAHLDKVSLVVEGTRKTSFHDVVVRSREGIDKLALHIDVDQANSLGDMTVARIVSIKKEV